MWFFNFTPAIFQTTIPMKLCCFIRRALEWLSIAQAWQGSLSFPLNFGAQELADRRYHLAFALWRSRQLFRQAFELFVRKETTQ